MPPDPLPVTVAPSAYRDAVMLIASYAFSEAAVFDELVATADRDLLVATCVIAASGVAMLAENAEASFEAVMASLGVTAEHLAAGGGE